MKCKLDRRTQKKIKIYITQAPNTHDIQKTVQLPSRDVDPHSLNPDPDPIFQVNPDTDPENPIRIQGFDDKKLKKKIQQKIFLCLFLIKIAIYLCPSYRRSLQPSKENIQHGYGYGSRNPIESVYGSRDPIQSGYGNGSGSTALLSRIVADLRELSEQDVALLIVVQTEEHSRHVHQLLAHILLIMRYSFSDFRCNN
jgi:hypothetical protein